MKGLFQVGLGLVAAGLVAAQDVYTCASTSLQEECSEGTVEPAWPNAYLNGTAAVCGSRLEICECPSGSSEAIYMRAVVQVPEDYDSTNIVVALAGSGAEFYQVSVSVSPRDENAFCAVKEETLFVFWNREGLNNCDMVQMTEFGPITTSICEPATQDGFDTHVGGSTENPKCVCFNRDYGEQTEDEFLEVNVVLARMVETEGEPCEVSVALVLNNHDSNVEELVCDEPLRFVCDECDTEGPGGPGSFEFSEGVNQTCAVYLEPCVADSTCNEELFALVQGFIQPYQMTSPNACSVYECSQCYNALSSSGSDLIAECTGFPPFCYGGADDDDDDDSDGGIFDEYFNTTCGTLLKTCEQTPQCLAQLNGLLGETLDERDITDPIMLKLMACASCIFNDRSNNENETPRNVALCNTTAGLLPEEWRIFGEKYNETCGSLLRTCLDDSGCRAQVFIYAETNQVAANATADFTKLAACSVCLYNKADAAGPNGNVTDAATCNSTTVTDSNMASQSITSSLFMMLTVIAMFLRQ